MTRVSPPLTMRHGIPAFVLPTAGGSAPVSVRSLGGADRRCWASQRAPREATAAHLSSSGYCGQDAGERGQGGLRELRAVAGPRGVPRQKRGSCRTDTARPRWRPPSSDQVSRSCTFGIWFLLQQVTLKRKFLPRNLPKGREMLTGPGFELLLRFLPSAQGHT